MKDNEIINTVGELIDYLRDNFKDEDTLIFNYARTIGATIVGHERRPLLKSVIEKKGDNEVEFKPLIY